MYVPDSVGYPGEFPDLLQAVARGELADIGSLITRRIPLEDLVDKGIKALIYEKNDDGESVVTVWVAYATQLFSTFFVFLESSFIALEGRALW